MESAIIIIAASVLSVLWYLINNLNARFEDAVADIDRKINASSGEIDLNAETGNSFKFTDFADFGFLGVLLAVLLLTYPLDDQPVI